MADDKAVDALLAAAGVNEGRHLDPDDGPQFGAAWANGVGRQPAAARPTRSGCRATAVAAFIDAKSDTTNAPLYANLAGNFTAAGGAGGTISGLRPVHVPALDDEAVDVIVGPSRGFAWAEDGTLHPAGRRARQGRPRRRPRGHDLVHAAVPRRLHPLRARPAPERR